MTYPARVAAAQATLGFFLDKRWKPGKRECGQMTIFHLGQMGHRPELIDKIGEYKSLKSGVRRLRDLGFSGLPAALDAHFERIVPAFAWPGDIVQIRSDDDAIGGLFVVLGNGRVLGFQEEVRGAAVLQPKGAPMAAWRIPYAGDAP